MTLNIQLPKLLLIFTTGSSPNISESTDRPSPNFQDWQPYGVDDCCEIGLRLLKGCGFHGKLFLSIQSTQCFSSQWPMCDKLCAFNHDAYVFDCRRCNIHEVEHRRVMLTTPWHLYTDDLPWCSMVNEILYFFDPQDCVRVRRDTTRSASAALSGGEPINWTGGE